MPTAKVFKSGNSQAVRLPKEFRFRTREVEISRRGDEVILREAAPGLGRALLLLGQLGTQLFPDGRKDPPPQQRRGKL